MPSNPTSWRPLLEGEEATPVWQTIEAIAEALAAWPENELLHPGLGGGAAGLALFFAYLAEATGEDKYADVAMSYLDLMIDGLPLLASVPGLYSGFTGPAWTLEHLSGRLLDSSGDDTEATREIDETLREMLRRGTWPHEYDLISGLAGIAVYALEALSRPAGRELVELVLRQLGQLAVDRPEGSTWYTPPEWLLEHQRRRFPGGYYNLGIAHGVPAIAAVLATLDAAGLEPARPLLLGTVAWILAHRLDPGAGSCYPHFLVEGADPEPSRLAWCYGDPGVASALLLAARRAAESDWEREALRIARHAATRPAESSGIVDAGLCHGAAGLGHLFNRLYQETGDTALAEPARFWFRQTLAMRQPGAGAGGYLSWTSNGLDDPKWIADRGFLTGTAGIGLALLAAVSPVAPDWDRLLMISLPPVNCGSAGARR